MTMHTTNLVTPHKLIALGTVLVLALTALATVVPAHAAAPSWPHVQVTAASGAVAYVETGVTSGGTMRIQGEGWKTSFGTGSLVVIKLNGAKYSQYFRTTDIRIHPTNNQPDATIWEKVRADANGSFSITTDVPPGSQIHDPATNNDKLTVSFQAGLEPGDVPRTGQSEPIEVDGVTGSDPQSSTVTCVAPAGGATVEVIALDADGAPITDPATTPIAFGGKVRIKGTGWCADKSGATSTLGGSTIALKLDDGRYARPANQLVHANATIWHIIEANDEDGSFDEVIDLPDGTSATSVPALDSGTHQFRLLSGSLWPDNLASEGDKISRTMLSKRFAVDSFKPNSVPPAPEATEDLTAATANGATATMNKTKVTLRLAQGSADQWAYLYVYDDSSPRPTGVWQQLADGTISTDISQLVLTAGDRVKVAAVNEDGEIYGWAWVTIPKATATLKSTYPKKLTAGKRVQIQFTVSATPTTKLKPTLGGTIKVMRGKTTVATAKVGSVTGNATVTLPKVKTATKQKWTATYVGNSSVTAANSQIAVTATKAKPKIKMTAKRARVAGNTSITVKVTAAGLTPKGKITLWDGKKKIGVAKVKNGKARHVHRFTTAGRHKLSVKYSGDKAVKKALKTIKVKVKS